MHKEKLVKDTRNIQAEFNVLFTIVYNFIVRQKVMFDAFVLFLQREPGYCGKSLFEAEMSDLHKAKDLNSVLELLKATVHGSIIPSLATLLKMTRKSKHVTKIISTSFMSIATTVFVLS